MVDNSNIFISAMKFGAAILNGEPITPNCPSDPTVRLNSKALALLLRGHREGDRVVAGSKPPANGAVWKYWEQSGFTVKVCSRDVDTGAEDLVDEFLHAQAQRAVMVRQDEAPGGFIAHAHINTPPKNITTQPSCVLCLRDQYSGVVHR
jgi:hypothetical protein